MDYSKKRILDWFSAGKMTDHQQQRCCHQHLPRLNDFLEDSEEDGHFLVSLGKLVLVAVEDNDYG